MIVFYNTATANMLGLQNKSKKKNVKESVCVCLHVCACVCVYHIKVIIVNSQNNSQLINDISMAWTCSTWKVSWDGFCCELAQHK